MNSGVLCIFPPSRILLGSSYVSMMPAFLCYSMDSACRCCMTVAWSTSCFHVKRKGENAVED